MIFIKNKLGLLHSIDDKPSLIDDDGNKYWHINGVPSRSDISLPYVEKSNGEKHYRLEDGGYKIIDKQKEEWLNKDNRFHRESGPAYITYYENGNIKFEVYYFNAKNIGKMVLL